MDPYRSAQVILPVVLEAINLPWRIVDVGCGDGGWLLAAHELEPQAALLGIDLDPLSHVPTTTVEALHGTVGALIGMSPFLAMDLRNPPPLSTTSPWRRSDLVICLETAEHLPPEFGDGLTDFVADLASTPHSAVLWSAAVPGQGPYPPEGADDPNGSWHHNEQPPAYWEGLFAARGFEVDVAATMRLQEVAAKSSAVDQWYRGVALLARKTL